MFIAVKDSALYLRCSHQKAPKILKRNVQKEKKQREGPEKRVLFGVYCFMHSVLVSVSFFVVYYIISVLFLSFTCYGSPIGY